VFESRDEDEVEGRVEGPEMSNSTASIEGDADEDVCLPRYNSASCPPAASIKSSESGIAYEERQLGVKSRGAIVRGGCECVKVSAWT
jgi:hypothetical protein